MRSRLIPSLAALLVVALALGLGDWQLRRAAQKAGEQAQRDRAAAQPPLEYGVPGDTGNASREPLRAGLRVALTGRFVADRTIFLDNRTHAGVAGFHVLTPLRVDRGGPIVVVLRGWVAADRADRGRLPPVATPAGTVRIEGLTEPGLAQPIALGRIEAPGPADRLWQRFTTQEFGRWSGLEVAETVLRQTGGTDDGLVRDWPVPGNDVDKHRAYAFQWFLLAAITAGLWLWFVVIRRGRSG